MTPPSLEMPKLSAVLKWRSITTPAPPTTTFMKRHNALLPSSSVKLRMTYYTRSWMTGRHLTQILPLKRPSSIFRTTVAASMPSAISTLPPIYRTTKSMSQAYLSTSTCSMMPRTVVILKINGKLLWKKGCLVVQIFGKKQEKSLRLGNWW